MTTQKCVFKQALKMENGRKNMDDFPSEIWQMDNVLNVIILRNNNYSNFFSGCKWGKEMMIDLWKNIKLDRLVGLINIAYICFHE